MAWFYPKIYDAEMYVINSEVIESYADDKRNQITKVLNEAYANDGHKVVKYMQTKRQRITHKVTYMLFAILSIVLLIWTLFLPAYATESAPVFVAVLVTGLAWLYLIYNLINQMKIRDAMTNNMYRLAVKRFCIAAFIYAVLVSVSFAITMVITILRYEYDGFTRTTIIVFYMQLISVILSWGILSMESRRKLVLCDED